AAQVKYGKKAGTRDSEQGHGFGKTVDGVTPRLAQQEENGGNQSSGVSDSDPPDKVDDGESPADGDIYAPNSDSANEQIADGVEPAHEDQKREAESNEPSVGRRASEHDGADFVCDRGEGVPRLRSEERRVGKEGRGW